MLGLGVVIWLDGSLGSQTILGGNLRKCANRRRCNLSLDKTGLMSHERRHTVRNQENHRKHGRVKPRVGRTGRLAERFKRVDWATAVNWKMLMVAESRFRRLNVLYLSKNVH